jgi:hypothetical protein
VKGIKDEIQDIMDEAKLSVLHIIEENFIEPKLNATNSK